MTTKYIYKNINGHAIREHRIVWEKYNNAKLLRWASIHHLNGKKCDNRIENLQVMSKGKHNSIHQHRLGTSKKFQQLIPCACGCGELINKLYVNPSGYFDGRERKYKHNHDKKKEVLPK